MLSFSRNSAWDRAILRPSKSICGRRVWQSRSEERRVGKECRYQCDWSSDVCSSDLADAIGLNAVVLAELCVGQSDPEAVQIDLRTKGLAIQIGRASCRERV